MPEILQYPFMQRAIAAGLVLGLVLALLGVFVVLRRMAFFSDGVAHGSLAGVAVGVIFSFNPLISALVFSVLFALVIYWVEKRYGISSDTAIGILFTSGMALGVLLMSLQAGYQAELVSFLFGNILAIAKFEFWLILIIGLSVFIMIWFLIRPLALLSLDEETAYISGIKVKILQPLLYVVLAVSVVLGIKVLGIILVSALLIIPVATAKIFTKSFRQLIVMSLVFSELAVVFGIAASYYLDLPTGPTIVLTAAFVFVLGLAYSGLKNLGRP